ncbi:MAG: DUF1887 family protein [Clostridia bacterium]|nr:DUF1887 family protein [Clostridia bacterium]
MTVVEFFDKVSIDNMVSCITMEPDKIIFIGDKKTMNKYKEHYERFLRRKKLDIELEYVNINRNSISNVVGILEKIVLEDDYCVFDLTGGEDLVLVAMGIVYERYKDEKQIQMHRFNISTGSIFDCDSDGIIPYEGEPEITVEDNIALYGGTLMRNSKYDTHLWHLTDEFVSDVMALWHLCKRNPGRWNAMINTVAAVISLDSGENGLYLTASRTEIANKMKKKGQEFAWVEDVADELVKLGVIAGLEDSGEYISFAIKDHQIKRLLRKSGTILEVAILILSLTCKDPEGNAVYTDAETGVYIDWDAMIHTGSESIKDTVNEVDVVLMHGLQPVFISCKNGRVEDEELYKIKAVAERFGGPYVKTVLVCSYMGNVPEESKIHIRQRAKDMDIDVIEGVHEISDDDIRKKLRKIVL